MQRSVDKTRKCHDRESWKQAFLPRLLESAQHGAVFRSSSLHSRACKVLAWRWLDQLKNLKHDRCSKPRVPTCMTSWLERLLQSLALSFIKVAGSTHETDAKNALQSSRNAREWLMPNAAFLKMRTSVMSGPFKSLFIHVNGTRNTKRVGFTKSLEKPNVHVKGLKGWVHVRSNRIL